jgi:purine-binding chemotaxis protein CheW
MSAPEQFCTFRLDALLFGIEVDRVEEVLRHRPLTPVPLAPPQIAGLINLRGQIVPAIDLRRCLGLPAHPDGLVPGNVVLSGRDGPLSLLVDAIGDVVAVDDSRIEPVPDSVEPVTRRLLRGVCQLSAGLLLLLDAPALITCSIANDG